MNLQQIELYAILILYKYIYFFNCSKNPVSLKLHNGEKSSSTLLFALVVQTPAEVIVRSGQTFTLSCSHSISTYNTILWYYQNEHGQGMHIIGYSFHGAHNVEKDDKKYNLVGDAKSSVNLTISELTLKESAVYFCAASAYFGNGTKLTVLGKKKNFFFNYDKINDKRSTLVCVASGFYPDHVSVSWKVNGVERQDSVSTDTSQDKINDKRSTLVCVASGFYPDHMSRSFACTVHFFNGDEYTVDISKYIE
uniref:Ig-like domain-containing protein n=1 Tax=Sinocyclocheilus anshuiensis TaxID=1608454 RepID=A0A671RW61_9TELE